MNTEGILKTDIVKADYLIRLTKDTISACKKARQTLEKYLVPLTRALPENIDQCKKLRGEMLKQFMSGEGYAGSFSIYKGISIIGSSDSAYAKDHGPYQSSGEREDDLAFNGRAPGIIDIDSDRKLFPKVGFNSTVKSTGWTQDKLNTACSLIDEIDRYNADDGSMNLYSFTHSLWGKFEDKFDNVINVNHPDNESNGNRDSDRIKVIQFVSLRFFAYGDGISRGLSRLCDAVVRELEHAGKAILKADWQ